MASYRLHFLRATMASRGRARAEWDEADRIEVIALHEGVVDALQEKVHALKRRQAETAAELDALLPSVLDKAFRGKL